VRLADQRTVKESKEELQAEVRVVTNEGNQQGVDMIIGLPYISRHFKETLIDMPQL